MTTYTIRIGVVGLLFSTMAINAHAETAVEMRLNQFKRNPKQFMSDQRNVQKQLQNYRQIGVDKATGEAIEQFVNQTPIEIGKDSKFTKEQIDSRSFIDTKNIRHEGYGKTAAELKRAKVEGRAEFNVRTDNPANIVGELALKTLEQMEGYKSSRLNTSPWSGDYWAIFSGKVAKRYADPQFMEVAATADWERISRYLETNPASSVDQLSPAEKYDLLVGDENKTLTKMMLADGKSYWDRDHKVETWMGICHGWAASAFMERRPLHATKVMGADGKTKITFYPSDIKALASLLWAQVQTETKFVGTRCSVKNPAKDENGRILEESCFDTNPGTWHLALINRLGVNKQSFIIDATFDYEVWNQPVYAYSYKYFNPQTNREVSSLSAARVKLGDFAGDKFSRYRNKEKVDSIVGIAMELVYIAETRPTTASQDSASADRRVAVNYLYDLELDKDGNIIGGEWYHDQHPDFLWAPKDGTQALSRGDGYLAGQNDQNHWKLRHKTPLPATWREAAIKYSSPVGQPLTRIMKELLQKSNQVDFWLFGERHWNKYGTGNEERF